MFSGVYILLIIFNSTGKAVHSVEFNGKDSCLAAKQEVVRNINSFNMVALCVKKGK